MRGRREPQIFANPTLVGAVTTLVAVIGLLLAYNANNGLPFVPTYDVKAIVPNASELTAGNEVRIGGKRVGTITSISARVSRDGVPAAVLALKLEAAVKPLSVDTEVTIRPRSPLGLKYLELRPGNARRGIPQNGSLPVSRARAIVDLDQVVNALDRPARAGLQGVLRELGTGVAGRGASFNDATAASPSTFGHLRAVARNFAAPRTDLAGLIAGLSSATHAVAPVASTLGGLVGHAAVTAEALALAGDALGQGIEEVPPTEDVALRSLPRVRPVLADATRLLRAAAPGVHLLPRASTRLASAVEAGTPVLRRATALADRLGVALGAVEALVRRPSALGAVRKLTVVVRSLAPTLRYVDPWQIRCNYLGLWTRNASSAISEGDANGTWFRFIPIIQNDEALQRATPAPNLHVNPYPHTGQNGECEAGNEPFLPGQQIGNVPGKQPGHTQTTAPPPGVPR